MPLNSNTAMPNEKVIHRDGYEVVKIPNTMKAKVSVSGSGGIDDAAIKRAEKALEGLSAEFSEWMSDEVNRLINASELVAEKGLVEPQSSDLYRASHDIKGLGETLKFPLATLICASLCKLLDCANNGHDIPMDLIKHHVDAVAIINRDKIREDNHPTARAVADKLVDVVLEYSDFLKAKEIQEEERQAETGPDQ